MPEGPVRLLSPHVVALASRGTTLVGAPSDGLQECVGHTTHGTGKLAIPATGTCVPGTRGGPLTAAACTRGTSVPAGAPLTYGIGCQCRSGGTGSAMCPAGLMAATIIGDGDSRSPPGQSEHADLGISDMYNCGNSDYCGIGTPWAACYGSVTVHPSETTWGLRDACCRNDATRLACTAANRVHSSCPAGSLGTLPPAQDGAPKGSIQMQANYACAPEHCWGASDACDDVMASVAMAPAPDASTCVPLPVYDGTGGVPGSGACTTASHTPAACSNMTSTSSTGDVVTQWANTVQDSGSETRRAWRDYAALQYCNTTGAEGDTCACLRASESTYKDPCLGKTYSELLQQFEDAFGVAAVESSGIVARKACWWSACDVDSAGQFVQTSAIREANGACPNVALCTATIKDLSLNNPTDVVCISQNCSSHSCAQTAAMMRDIVAEKGALPAYTGTRCPQCNDAINAALVGTGVPLLPLTPSKRGAGAAARRRGKAALLGGGIAALIVAAACVVVGVVYLRKRRVGAGHGAEPRRMRRPADPWRT